MMKLQLSHLKKLTREDYNNYHLKQLRIEQRYGILMIQEHKELPGKWEKFIAIDNHPLSVAEDVGLNQVLKALELRYNCPCRKYFTDSVISKICEGPHGV